MYSEVIVGTVVHEAADPDPKLPRLVFQALRDTKLSPMQTTAYLLTTLHKVSTSIAK